MPFLSVADAPPIRDEKTLGLAAWVGQTRGMASAHRHLDLEINFVRQGTMRYLIGGSIVTLLPNRLCLLWGGVPHQMLRDPAFVHAIWVTVPIAVVVSWGLPDALTRLLLTQGFVADAAPRPDDTALLEQWVNDLPGRSDGPNAAVAKRRAPNQSETSRIVLLEIEARLRRLALALPAHTPPPVAPRVGSSFIASPSDGGLVAVEAMARHICQNFLTSGLSIADIAQAACLHPNYAMTIFRHHTGMTLSRYLTLQRVAHAQRLLAATNEPIETIAFACGFGSISRFYEAFRQQTGNSPRRFRRHLEGK